MKKLILCILAALLVSVCPDAQPQATTAVKPRGRALLVGGNEYQVKGINPTPGAIEDALAIGKLIQDKGWFAPQEVKTLIGERATAANIEREFHEWLIRGTSPDDRVFFSIPATGRRRPMTTATNGAPIPPMIRTRRLRHMTSMCRNGGL